MGTNWVPSQVQQVQQEMGTLGTKGVPTGCRVRCSRYWVRWVPNGYQLGTKLGAVGAGYAVYQMGTKLGAVGAGYAGYQMGTNWVPS